MTHYVFSSRSSTQNVFDHKAITNISSAHKNILQTTRMIPSASPKPQNPRSASFTEYVHLVPGSNNEREPGQECPATQYGRSREGRWMYQDELRAKRSRLSI